MRFLAVFTDARAEEGEHFAPGPLAVQAEEAHVVSVVEGHLPFVAVQVHPDPLRGRPELQPRPRLRAGPVLTPVTQP